MTSNKKQIDALIAGINKKFGDGALADMSLIEADFPSISTGFAN